MTVDGTSRPTTPGSTPIEPGVSLPASGETRSRARRTGEFVSQHPVLTVALVATFARVVMVVVVGPLRPGVFVPDEGQYLELAASVARGDGAEAWQPGYGQSLYDSTATFMRPLTALISLFGVHQIVGQLLAAAAGVLAAALTTVLALRAVRPGYALFAGLVVALLPSQVFWSSVVLRESMVWAALLALALSVTLTARALSRRHLLAAFALALVAGTALADLRQQTAFVAVWCLVPVVVVVGGRFRLLSSTGALVVALLAPMLAGMGVGGFTLVEQTLPALATIRGNLSLGAESSFIDKTVLPPPPGSSSSEQPDGLGARPRDGGSDSPETGPGSDSTGSGTDAGPGDASVDPPRDTVVLTAPSGEQVLVEDGAGATLSALPGGLVAVALRPLPWEPTTSSGVLFAKVEAPAWALLYLLAAVGAAVGWRRRDALAYPFTVTLGVVLVAAVTQGNLGTAFRHRGQILWALAVLAAVGLQYLADRRRSTTS